MLAFERLTSLTEIADARHKMIEWYRPYGRDSLVESLNGALLAPGARDGLMLLRRAGVRIAFVSLTWQFAVDWFAAQLGADYAIGTAWLENDEVVHFWPEDKAAWLTQLLAGLALDPSDLVAVGDSTGDLPMLRLAGKGYYVGATLPIPMDHVHHWPDANIEEIVTDMLGIQEAPDARPGFSP
jgi:phosphoserine phosphatase